MNEISGYVVFTDLKGFSSMNEPETFYEHTIRPLAKKIREYKHKAEVWNTWGDALVAVFKKGTDALELMVEYRDFFRKNKLLGLQPRIAGHYGVMKLYNDPMINNMENVLGDTVNTAARIEPITFPGEIYVSEKFYKEVEEEKEKLKFKNDDREIERYSKFEFTPLGKWDMPKKHGIIELFRVFHVSEESWNINSLFVKNENENIDVLFTTLNIEKKLQEAKKLEKILEARQLNSKQDVLDHIAESYPELFKKNEMILREDLAEQINLLGKEQTEQNINGPLMIALSELFRDIGEYDKAISCINAAKEWEMHVVPTVNRNENDSEDNLNINKKKYWTESMKGVSLYPFKENAAILKLEAEIRSKRATYTRKIEGNFNKQEDSKKAKNILIKLLQQNPNDTDIMNKLAAQLKREAFQLILDPLNVSSELVFSDSSTPNNFHSNEMVVDVVTAKTVRTEINKEKNKENEAKWKILLNEAKYLYLEAFRKSRDYYPAINAAYISKLLRESNGWHLANYIFNTWKQETGESWWLDSTLAETQLLLGEFKFCYQRMERAVEKHKPPFFERHATRDQIENFIKIYGKDQSEDNSLKNFELQYAALLSILLQDPSVITKENKTLVLDSKNEAELEKNKNYILSFKKK